MRITIDHRTLYRFTQPQVRLVQALRLSPGDTDDQTVASWRIDVDCDARLREARDGLGNRVTMLYADGPIEAIEIRVAGEVLTAGTGGLVRGTDELLPAEFYLRETDRTVADAALRAFVGEAIARGANGDALARAARALNARFAVEEPEDHVVRDAADAFSGKTASVRELAQMLVAGLRAANVPARYVSGYRQGTAEPSAPHGWVEAYVGAGGWLAIDPSTGAAVDEGYVRVAVGLDVAGAAPVAGSRLGPGEEKLDVALRVARVNGA